MKHVIVLLLCAFISIAALHNTGANEQEHVPIATPVQEKVQGSSGVVAIEGGLRLEDALKLSLQYNRELQIGLEEKNIAKGRTWEAYGEALPTVTMNGSYTRMDEVLSFEFDGMKVDLGFLNNYSTTLNVTQPLYRGGRTGAALRA